MPDYKKMYSVLFNKISNVVDELKEVQRETEEIYMKSDETPLKIFTEKDNDPKE